MADEVLVVSVCVQDQEVLVWIVPQFSFQSICVLLFSRLCYVRSLMDMTVRCKGITTVAVSDVAGDIATASNMSKSNWETRLSEKYVITQIV